MRQIKFRARYKITEKGFVYFSIEDLLHKEGPVFPEDLAEINQFTGLLDKNGTEIYEGDIVKWSYRTQPTPGNTFTGEVIFTDYLQKGDLDNDSRFVGFMLKFNDGGICDFPNNSVEVIGNIYENPELLDNDK